MCSTYVIGARRAAYKVRPFRWMGAIIVEVTSLQAKPEMRGGNLPCAAQHKKRRGRRGRRKGRARGRQPRCPPEGRTSTREKGRDLSEVRVGIASNRKLRARNKRRDWMSSRLHVLEGMFAGFPPLEHGHPRLCSQGIHGGSEFVPVKENAEVCLTAFVSSLRRKKFPLPPGIGYDDVFPRYLDLKYGTWSDVSMGRLEDGDYLGDHYLEPTQVNSENKKTFSESFCRCRTCKVSTLCAPHGHGMPPGVRTCGFCGFQRHPARHVMARVPPNDRYKYHLASAAGSRARDRRG